MRSHALELLACRLFLISSIIAGAHTLAAEENASAVRAKIHINNNAAASTINPDFVGSNVPAWLGSSLQNATLQARARAANLQLIRIPGGSWSDDYGWVSCEKRANQTNAWRCGEGWESWAARPTDFINFIHAIGLTGDRVVYTLNVNASAQESAALAAFFNAETSDTTEIGVDLNGFDWKTAGDWAQLRATDGNATLLGIKYWEFGNEDYGGTPGTGGSECASYGWELSWTCDGAEYINGKAGHDGYLAVRAAMKAIDPAIQLGAVGTEGPGDYSNWGIKVIQNAGSVMDYYVVHPYAYDNLPPDNAGGWAQILAQPESHWASLKTNLQDAFNSYAGGRQIPVAATEYNVVSVSSQDGARLMTRAVNALFIADSIGQAMQNGFAFTNQWDLSNGCQVSCYDLLQVDYGFYRAPQYYAFPLWTQFGSQMLTVTSSLDASSALSVYAGRPSGSTLTLIAINKTNAPIAGTITFDGGVRIARGTAEAVKATSLNNTWMTFNGVRNPSDNLSSAPPKPLKQVGGSVRYTFAAGSITLLRMNLAP